MPRSDEAEMWFSAVYKAVQEVPYGRVTSYGHIATLIGYRGAARQEVALQQEGVQIEHSNMGERSVDLGTYGWFPNHLPSEDSENENGA
ncbi:hypothetical protein D0865_14286 [Hortaea werneckii]|uniref:Methylated-DNA-[protein]-cysteine S-methyltransferase DNA binding domain-containing protein n=1 Tax=Hortaea werneckii TaxID=91943 RepID=A0A3M7B2S8_HORWE|nr:hypothetical protein D0865_14286 [Hortaea werneckii]